MASNGDAVRLYQAQDIDDHDSVEVCQLLRHADEKDDWRRIKSKDLNKCYSSLSFLDTIGIRIHLPAYLLADINGDYKFDLAIEFTETRDYKMQQFSLFAVQQKGVIADYLRFLQEQLGHWLEVHKINLALVYSWDSDQRLS